MLNILTNSFNVTIFILPSLIYCFKYIIFHFIYYSHIKLRMKVISVSITTLQISTPSLMKKSKSYVIYP